jgi:molybdopterin-synthase adenylyltransferase
MNCKNLERFSRQTILPEIGEKGQIKISRAKIIIVGVGALGTAAAELLIRAGVQNLTLIDPDVIELSNLQRQNLFDETDLNKHKVEVAKGKLSKINQEARIVAKTVELNEKNIKEIIEKENTDLILDCTDNMKTRFLINDYCKENSIIWIFSSVAGTKGMLATISPKGPGIQKIIPENAEGEISCTQGILNTITRIISAMQVTLALKIITGAKVNYNELILYDAWENKLEKLKFG